MGKEITVRGKKWERQNSLWVIWSFFGFSSISFLNIGIKTKEKKWIITGIIYFVVLWGGIIIAGDASGKVGEILSDVVAILYIVSIVHTFLVRKSYLKKYDMILRNNEVELEREKAKRARESLERANEIKNIESEAKKVSKNLKANEQIQVDEGDKKEEQVSNDIGSEQGQRKLSSENTIMKKKFLIIIPIVIIGIAIAVFSSGDEEDYLDVVKLTDDSFTGAEFDLSFKEAKAIIGRELGIGDLNSNGGWQKIEDSEAESTGVETYGIVGTTGMMGAQLAVNPKTDNVVMVALFTKFDVSSSLDSFCKVFQESLNMQESSRDTLAEIFTNIENEDGATKDEANGVIFYAGPFDDGNWEQLSISAASKEYAEQQK